MWGKSEGSRVGRVEFQATPNPNALKCVVPAARAARLLAPELGEKLRSYTSADAAADDPLARDLLGVAGITGVLIQPGWVTVNKAPDAAWKTIKPAVEKLLLS